MKKEVLKNAITALAYLFITIFLAVVWFVMTVGFCMIMAVVIKG